MISSKSTYCYAYILLIRLLPIQVLLLSALCRPVLLVCSDELQDSDAPVYIGWGLRWTRGRDGLLVALRWMRRGPVHV